MPGRRNFVYKHHMLARASLPLADPSSNVPSSDAKTPDPVSPATPASPSPAAPQTTPAAASSAPPAASSAASTPASSALSSASSAAVSSLSSSASSLSLGHASTPSTPSAVSPTTAASKLPVATQATPGISYTPTSTLGQSASATPSSTSSGGVSTSTIVGGVAGTLAGIAILGLLLMWCMRRQRDRDVDDFDSQAFKRQSAMLVDDPAEPPQSYNPRPPTMIERHNASPALAAQSGHAGQNFYGNYGGYAQQPSYPDMAQSPGGYGGYDDSQQQIARQPSNVGYSNYDSQQQLARQPSNAQYLTRQPSAAAGYAPPPPPPNPFGSDAHYIDLNRSSVSPYQAAQYADISRQLGATDPNQHGHPPADELLDGPLPSPFDDHVAANPMPGNAAVPHQRPSVHFEEGDAYGGI